MKQPFLNDDGFFKSNAVTEGGDLMKAKYVKRTGVKGNYKYWYKDTKTGKLVSDKQSKDKKEKGERLNKLKSKGWDFNTTSKVVGMADPTSVTTTTLKKDNIKIIVEEFQGIEKIKINGKDFGTFSTIGFSSEKSKDEIKKINTILNKYGINYNDLKEIYDFEEDQY